MYPSKAQALRKYMLLKRKDLIDKKNPAIIRQKNTLSFTIKKEYFNVLTEEEYSMLVYKVTETYVKETLLYLPQKYRKYFETEKFINDNSGNFCKEYFTVNVLGKLFYIKEK
mgnify:CR=1 FL=1